MNHAHNPDKPEPNLPITAQFFSGQIYVEVCFYAVDKTPVLVYNLANLANLAKLGILGAGYDYYKKYQFD